MYKLKNNVFYRAGILTSGVIRRRYSLLEVPWRRIHNFIAAAMSICVAYGNKVMDTRRPQPAGCGSKYDIDSIVQCGRSMIEMLGVLAIIAVLSVGGIAGYSKAMEKYKVNKLLEEYSMLIFGSVPYLEQIKNLTYDGQGDVKIDATAFLQSLDLFPQSWSIENNTYDSDTPHIFIDSYGNWGRIYSRNHKYTFTLVLGGLTKSEEGNYAANYSPLLCTQLTENLAKPLSSVLYDLFLWRGKAESYRLYGNNYCNGKDRSCLSQTPLTTIHKYCSNCNSEGSCTFTLEI